MTDIFTPIEIRLSASGEHAPMLIATPLLLADITAKPIGNSVYTIQTATLADAGRLLLTGTQWEYEGSWLNELEQEELAFKIWRNRMANS